MLESGGRDVEGAVEVDVDNHLNPSRTSVV
jgi:hypothetical protein